MIKIQDLNSSDRWKKIKAERRTRYKDFYSRLEPGGDLALVEEYFESLGRKFSDDEQVEDQIAEIYIETVLNNELFDTPIGFDYRAKEVAEAEFINKYGTEMYEYAQQYLASGKNVLPYEAEYLNARKQFEFYWEASEKAVIEAEADPETAEALLSGYQQLTQGQRDDFNRLNPDEASYIARLQKKISNVKEQLRIQNPGLDGFLFRWGYPGKLKNPDNLGKEDTWSTVDHISPEVYQNGLRKFNFLD